MSGLKTIRRRIASVKNTKQITRAMKLVSAAKLRRAQDAALTGRRFSEELSTVLEAIVKELPPDFEHPIFAGADRVIKKKRAVVIAGERGLCGAYNTNVLKMVQADVLSSDAQWDFVSVGRRAVSAVRKLEWQTVRELEGLSEDASTWPIASLATELLQDYMDGEYDELVVYYTKFVSAMTQQVKAYRLLPIERASVQSHGENAAEQSNIKFDPHPGEGHLLERSVRMLIRIVLTQSALESKASEHAARMTAMDSATNNADDLISRLRLFYNRARQTAITRELIDIIGGAEAIK